MKRSGLWPGKAKPCPQRVLDQCILIAALLWRITKRDQPRAAAGQGEVGMGGRLGWGSLEKQTLNLVSDNLFRV